MADVSVKINADAGNAIKEFTKLTEETNKLKSSMTTIVKKGDMDNLKTYLEQQETAFKAVDTSGKAAAQSLALYQKALKSVLANNYKKEGEWVFSEKDTTYLREKIEYYQGIIDAAERAKIAEKEAAEAVKQAAKDEERALKEAAKEQEREAAATKKAEEAKHAFGKKIVELTRNIMGFQLIIAGVRKVLTGTTRLIKESAEAAAQAEQVYNKLDTVFAGMTTHMKTAYEIAGKLGTAISTSAGSLSTVGDLLQAQGMGTGESLQLASQWVSQFQDIINFKDIPMTLEEFSQNFMSGAAGNLRNFRTFGSIVRESAVNAELAAKGLDKLTGGQLELEKMTIRANMALEQQANAIGATSREWDTMESVTRRYNEAVKGFKENLGEVVNEVLKPYREIITKWLDQFNKGNNARFERKSGELDISAYDLTKEADLKNFKKQFGNRLADYKNNVYGSEGIEYVKNTFIEFGASVKLVNELFGDKLPSEIRETLEALEQQREYAIKDAKKSEAILASNSKYTSRNSSLLDLLGTINGVKINTSRYDSLATANAGSAILTDMLAPEMASIIQQAFASLKTAENKDFVDFMTVAFGDATEDAFKAKKSAIEDMYSAIANYGLTTGEVSNNFLYGKTGATTELEKVLEQLVTVEKQLVKVQEENVRLAEINENYNNAINPKQDVIEIISNAFGSEIASIEQQRRADISAIEAKYAITDAKYQEMIAKYGNGGIWSNSLKASQVQRQADIDAVNSRYNGQVADIENANAKSTKDAEMAKLTAFMSRYVDIVNDNKAVQYYKGKGYSDEMAKLKVEADKAAKMLDSLAESAGLTNYEYEENQKILDEYYENLKKQQTASESLGANILSSLGLSDIQNGILALQQTSAENGSQINGLVSLIIAILQKLEIWDDLMDAIDYVFDVINAVIRPISVMIQTLNKFAEGVFDVLEPLFPVFKKIAIAIITITGVVQMIKDITMGILYASTYQLGKAINQFSQISTDYSTMINGIKEIEALTFDIEKNTEKDDEAAYYQKLFQAGVINSDELAALYNNMDGVHWDSPTSTSLGSYVRGNGGITYYGDTTININAGDYTREQLVSVIEEAYQRSQQPGSLVYNYANV